MKVREVLEIIDEISETKQELSDITDKDSITEYESAAIDAAVTHLSHYESYLRNAINNAEVKL